MELLNDSLIVSLLGHGILRLRPSSSCLQGQVWIEPLFKSNPMHGEGERELRFVPLSVFLKGNYSFRVFYYLFKDFHAVGSKQAFSRPLLKAKKPFYLNYSSTFA